MKKKYLKNCILPRRFYIFVTVLLFLIPMGLFSQDNYIVFQDEFNGTEIDTSIWTRYVDGSGGGNNELQYYTDRPVNSYVENGNLILKCIKEEYQGPDGITRQYTSAKLITRGKKDMAYGRYEVRLKLPDTSGTWPAVWFLPTEMDRLWPDCGELDLVEHVGNDLGRIVGSAHTEAHNWVLWTQDSGDIHHDDVAENFHTYAIEWTPEGIDWYLDDTLFHTSVNGGTEATWPFHDDHYLIMNLAFGGTWGGSGGIDENMTSTQLEIDYVRVYSGPDYYGIYGDSTVYENEQQKVYKTSAYTGSNFNWTLPAGATLVSGQGTNEIVVDWGTTGGTSLETIVVTYDVAGDGSYTNTFDVLVEPLVIEAVLDDFESNRNLVYGEYISGTLIEQAANPAPDHVNDSPLVASYLRNGTQQHDNFAIQTSAIGNANDFVAGRKRILIDVYTTAPVGTEIGINFENGAVSNNAPYPAGRHSYYVAKTSKQNAWQTLELFFTHNPEPSEGRTAIYDINQFTLLCAPGAWTGEQYYFDNIRIKYEDSLETLEYFKSVENYDDPGLLTLGSASGTYTAGAANPQPDALNSSPLAGKYVRNPDLPYDMLLLSTPESTLNNVSDFKKEGKRILMDIYTDAPVGTRINLNFQNHSIASAGYPNGINSNYQAITTVQNGWETVEFFYNNTLDQATTNNIIDEIALLFAPGTNTLNTYYIDNIRIGSVKQFETEGGPFSIRVEAENFTAMSGIVIGECYDAGGTSLVGSIDAGDWMEYLVHIPEAGDYTIKYRTASALDTGELQLLVNGTVYALDAIPTSGGWRDWITVETAASLPAGTLTFKLLATSPSFDINYMQIEKASARAYPGGTSHAIPGIIKADHYDMGGEGVAYHDTTPANYGPGIRPEEGVDTENVDGTGHVGWISDGEWMEYSVNISEAGTYDIAFDLASDLSSGQFRLELDGTDVTGLISVDSSGGWYAFETKTVTGVELTGGEHILRFEVITGGFNIRQMLFMLPASQKSYTDGIPHAIPGIIEAEHFDLGGEGVAYHDTETAHYGDGSRPAEGVDTESVNGIIHVGWINDGEWLEYTVNVAETKAYDISFELASAYNTGSFCLDVDGLNVTGTVSVEDTGDWYNFETKTVSGINLTAGEHVIRFYCFSGGFNFGSMTFVIPPPVVENLVSPANGGVMESFTSEYGYGWVAADLTNGIVDEDGWSSTKYPGNQEFVFTFRDGKSAVLNEAVIYGGLGEGYYFSKDVQVWISADGTNFTLAANGALANSSGDVITLDLGGQTAKSVKLVVTSGHRYDYWELAEFIVNGFIE